MVSELVEERQLESPEKFWAWYLGNNDIYKQAIINNMGEWSESENLKSRRHMYSGDAMMITLQ